MRIDSYPDIEITILVQGEPIRDYNGPGKGLGNEAVAHIDCQSNATFKIRFRVQMEQFDFLGFFIYLDGQAVSRFSTGSPLSLDVLGGIVLEEENVLPKEFKFTNQEGSIEVEVWARTDEDEDEDEEEPKEDPTLTEQNKIWRRLEIGSNTNSTCPFTSNKSGSFRGVRSTFRRRNIIYRWLYSTQKGKPILQLDHGSEYGDGHKRKRNAD